MNDIRNKKSEQQTALEEIIVQDIRRFDGYALVWMMGIPVGQGHLVHLLEKFAQSGINVNQMLQITDRQGLMQLHITVLDRDLKTVIGGVHNLCNTLKTGKYGVREQITRIVLIGSGIRTYSHLTTTVFDILEEKKISVYMISSSEMSLSIYIDTQQASHAIILLHETLIR